MENWGKVTGKCGCFSKNRGKRWIEPYLVMKNDGDLRFEGEQKDFSIKKLENELGKGGMQ